MTPAYDCVRLQNLSMQFVISTTLPVGGLFYLKSAYRRLHCSDQRLQFRKLVLFDRQNVVASPTVNIAKRENNLHLAMNVLR